MSETQVDRNTDTMKDLGALVHAELINGGELPKCMCASQALKQITGIIETMEVVGVGAPAVVLYLEKMGAASRHHQELKLHAYDWNSAHPFKAYQG